MPQPLKLAPNLVSSLHPTKPTMNKAQIEAKTRQTAQDFESVYLNTMFSQMFTGLDGKGEFGKDSSSGVWRSFLTEQYAKSFAAGGGVGIADDIYSSSMAQQQAGKTVAIPPDAAPSVSLSL